jgi:hypothetical protein
MVQRERNLTIAVTDKPIKRLTVPFPEDFVRTIESKLTTKRLPKLSDVLDRARQNDRTNQN